MQLTAVHDGSQALVLTYGDVCTTFNGQIAAACIHIQTARAVARVICAVAVADDLRTALDHANAADTEAGTAIVADIKGRTGIHVKAINENSVAIPCAGVSGGGQGRGFHGQLTVIAANAEAVAIRIGFAVVHHHDI